MFEGSIIRTLRREAELLRQLQNSAAAIGIPSLVSTREPHTYIRALFIHTRVPSPARQKEREHARESARTRERAGERV